VTRVILFSNGTDWEELIVLKDLGRGSGVSRVLMDCWSHIQPQPSSEPISCAAGVTKKGRYLTTTGRRIYIIHEQAHKSLNQENGSSHTLRRKDSLSCGAS